MFGLWRMGGGDRNLGETGHLGDSRRCSMEVGDLTGAPTLVLGSETDGKRVGVLADVNVLDVGAGCGTFCLDCREGLRSCWLFFRERTPEFANEVREAVRDNGLVGDGSREGSGEAAADDDADVAEVCEASLDGHESVFWVTVAELAEESRDSVGWALRSLPGASGRPGDMLGDLSMSACVDVRGLAGEERRLDGGHTCHASS